MDEPRRLYRSTTNRVLAGVCGGLGDYFAIDPTLIRVIFVVLFFGAGVGLLAYLIMWLIIPEAGQANQPIDQRTEQAAKEIQQGAEKAAERLRNDRNGGRVIAGVILVILGVMAFGHTLWPWSIFRWDFFWPLVIVAIGVWIIIRRK